MSVANAPASRTFKLRVSAQPARVCLIQPSTLTSADAYGLDVVPPLGLAYIASALKGAGHHVTFVDGVGEALERYGRAVGYEGLLVHGLSIEEIVARIDPDAHVVGVSSMFSNQWLFIRDLLLAIRNTYPEKLVVMGGEHVTACADYIIESCQAADVCVLGEGEETIVDLVDAYRTGRPLAGVAGIVFRDNGKAVRTPRRGRIRAIDEIPEPDWSIVPIERYIDHGITYGANLGRSIPLLASRGCPFQCTFCSSPQMWTTLWSARKPELVVAEMKKYKTRYNVTNFDFYDLTAIVRKQWIADFCKLLIKEKVNVTWQLASGTRSEAIDSEITPLLYEAGCRLVIYAPESGSPEELKRIKKKVKLDRMIASMRDAHRAGIETKANMIFGMLGMTWRDVFHSYKFIARMALAGVTNVAGYPFSPYPGSEDFAKLVASGKARLNDDYFMGLLMLCRNLHTKNTVSYNGTFNSKVLAMICSGAFLTFYGVSFAVRPWRGFQIAYTNFVKREASSILTLAFTNVRRKKAAVKLLDAEHAQAVDLPSDLKIRNTYR
jgi:anaerobic magnesium-protoporphyrin IX monomethyl ester cyclase